MGRLTRTGLTATLCLGLGLGTLALGPAAVADPDGGSSSGGRAFPSQDEVDAAKERAAQKARDVGAIKAQLLLANQRLEQAALAAEQAAEAYNGAMWRLDQAKEEVRQAQAEAEKARATVADQREKIAAMVTRSYQHGTQLTALGAMMGANAPDAVMDQFAAFQSTSSSLQAD
jgi:hypothetical protein